MLIPITLGLMVRFYCLDTLSDALVVCVLLQMAADESSVHSKGASVPFSPGTHS